MDECTHEGHRGLLAPRWHPCEPQGPVILQAFSCILCSKDVCIFLGRLFSLLCHVPTINGGLSSASLILNFCFVLGCKAEIFLVAEAGVVATPGPCLADFRKSKNLRFSSSQSSSHFINPRLAL